MTSNRLMPIVLVVLGLALVGAGCGGGDDNKSSSSISKAEYIRKGNAICAAGNKKIEAKAGQVFGTKQKPSEGQLTQFASTVLLPSVEQEVAQLKKLGAPSGDEDKVKAILAAADDGIAKGKQDPLSLTQDKGGPFEKANSLARAYGLTVCGS